jgi:hypothetical protein
MRALILLLLLSHSVLAAGFKWEATTRHFDVKRGERSVRAEFPFRNSAKTPVRIESVRGVCVCCTSASATKKVLAPGESGAVIVKVDVERKRFPIVKPVTVKTDDGQTTVLLVEIVEAKL